jgi:EAL domain-containing protein (putative c-di-GMP-specific phosphodiesterase class I)
VLLIEVGGLTVAGEERAAELAARLVSALHEDDLVGQFGGDVLVVVARDVDDEVAGHELAAQLVDALAQPLDAARVAPGSVGVTIVRDPDTPISAVVARADAALYAAKNKASRDARGDAGEPRDGSRALLVEAAFERSSVEDFDVYYQPIVDLRDGSIAAVEAILRWEHPDLGTIAPGEFLAIAERRGQTVTLGRWTIDKACAQTLRWGATREGRPLRTCVNVAPAQVADPAFVEDIASSLHRHGATAHQVAFEVTEETLAALQPELQATLADAGLALILDHAGAQPPSPASLERLPVTMIKYDRAIVTGDCADGPPAMLRDAVALAHDLELPMVAKGVETREQLRALRECGVRYAQGYLFTRPQSAAAIEQLVRRERPFASLLARPPLLLGMLDLDGAEPAVEIGEPAVP